MKSAGNWLRVLLITSVICSTGCKTAPKIEVCLIGDTSSQCFDDRLEENEKSYDRGLDEMKGYVCTNPSDFNSLIEYCERRGKK
jgi:hypothetical protein